MEEEGYFLSPFPLPSLAILWSALLTFLRPYTQKARQLPWPVRVSICSCIDIIDSPLPPPITWPPCTATYSTVKTNKPDKRGPEDLSAKARVCLRSSANPTKTIVGQDIEKPTTAAMALRAACSGIINTRSHTPHEDRHAAIEDGLLATALLSAHYHSPWKE